MPACASPRKKTELRSSFPEICWYRRDPPTEKCFVWKLSPASHERWCWGLTAVSSRMSCQVACTVCRRMARDNVALICWLFDATGARPPPVSVKRKVESVSEADTLPGNNAEAPAEVLKLVSSGRLESCSRLLRDRLGATSH